MFDKVQKLLQQLFSSLKEWPQSVRKQEVLVKSKETYIYGSCSVLRNAFCYFVKFCLLYMYHNS